MYILVTNKGKRFNAEYAAPVDITENMVFMAKILNSDINIVHNIFSNEEETKKFTLLFNDADGEIFVSEFKDYINYRGISINDDGSVQVILKKKIVEPEYTEEEIQQGRDAIELLNIIFGNE